MLDVQNLSIAFSDGVIPFSTLSFSLKKNEVLAVIGASGLGKTTLLKSLGGIHQPHTGTIMFNHEDLSVNRHRIGYVPQGYGLYPWHSVKKNIELGRRIRKMPADPEFFSEIIEGFNLNALLDRSPRRLSGGEQQRVALARAFYLSPDLFLLDEPFSALDEITKETAYRLFDQVWAKTKPTTLLVTHSLDEALRFGDQILVMQDGKTQQLANSKTAQHKNALLKELRALLINPEVNI
jgi:NitT/TauT family transport system ATP-binding protein